MRRLTKYAGLVGVMAGAVVLGARAGADDPEKKGEGEKSAAVAKKTVWKQHDVRRPKPKAVEAGEGGIAGKAPADAVVLFDGSNLDAWKRENRDEPAKWKVVDGVLETTPGGGAIETKAKFGDVQLHLEWAAPSPAKGVGQNRGNSGVFLMGDYEIQVLDSYQAETYADGQAGAIYGQYPPLSNASRPPGAWQTYDIAFRRPQFDEAGKLLEPARITVFHNGILVQNNEKPFGPTSWLKWEEYKDKGGRGPIALQDHNHPVRYRNIWLRELPERAKPGPEHVAEIKKVPVSGEVLDRYVGGYGPGSRASVKVAREGDHLTVLFPSRTTPLDLIPISETTFDMPFTDGQFTFQVDQAGKTTGVHFRIGDSERDMNWIDPSVKAKTKAKTQGKAKGKGQPKSKSKSKS